MLIATLAAAPLAHADTFCVNRAGCADPGHNFTTIQMAVAAADANDPPGAGNASRDLILVGDGVFHEAVDNGFDNPIDIVGSGQRTATGGTLIERDPGASVRTVSMGASFGSIAASTIQDVTIHVAAGSQNIGLGTAGEASNLTVTAPSSTPLTNGVGIDVNGNGATVVSGVNVDLPGTAVGVRIRLADLERSSIKASTGVSGAGTTIRGSTIDANVGAFAGGLDLKLEDCVMRISGPGGLAFRATATGVNVFNRVQARHVTAIGDSNPTSLAVLADAEANMASANSAEVDIRSSILRGFAKNFVRSGNTVGMNDGTANITVAHSDYDSSIPADDNGGPGALNDTTPGGNTSADPRFRSATDLRLAFDSPLIDTGDPASPDPTAFDPDSPIDFDGFPRKTDGNADGVARADMGAFEFQQTPPAVTEATVTPTIVHTGEPVAFRGAGTDANGEPLSFRWDFGDGGSADTTEASHSYSTPGTKSATFSVRDFRGLQASVTRSITVNDPPRVTGLTVRRRIVAQRTLPQLTSSRRRATISFSLSEEAAVTLAFARKLPGRRVRRSGRLVCAKPTPRNRSARKCTRFRTVRTRISLRAKEGLNRVVFHGRLSRTRSLDPGAYRLTVAGRDADGERSEPRRAGFSLVRAKR